MSYAEKRALLITGTKEKAALFFEAVDGAASALASTLLSHADIRDLLSYEYVFFFGNPEDYSSECRKTLDALEYELLQYRREVHEINRITNAAAAYINRVLAGEFNSFDEAERLTAHFGQIPYYKLILTDCDRTLSDGADSSFLAMEYSGIGTDALSEIYAGDCFTNYQAFLADEFFRSNRIYTEESRAYAQEHIVLNAPLIDDLNHQQNTGILPVTGGFGRAWESILNGMGLNVEAMISSPVMSKYVKYAICSELTDRGIFVTAIGDSVMDMFMLKRANRAYVVTNKGYRAYLLPFLEENRHIHQLSYSTFLYLGVPAEEKIGAVYSLGCESRAYDAEIASCYSDAPVYGKVLREKHRRIGTALAEQIRAEYPGESYAVVAVMRSGLPAAMAIADTLDCPIAFYFPGSEATFLEHIRHIPQIGQRKIILCDGVVDSGKTLCRVAELLSEADTLTVVNVFSAYGKVSTRGSIYLGRISTHRFPPNSDRSAKGIDTSEKLFEREG